MNSIVRKVKLSIATVCVAAVAPFLAYGQESSADQPAAIVSFKKIDGQLADIKYLGTKAGFEDQVAMVPMMARGFLPGVDLKKPMGAVVWFEGNEPRVLGMVPVSDIDSVLDQLSGFGMNVDEDGDFYFLEGPNAADIVITAKGGYAFISDTKEHLASLPANPETLLNGVAQDYTMGMKLFVQRIPANLREMAISQMREGFDQAMEEMDGGDLEMLQRDANEMQIKQLVDMVQNSDKLEVGMGVVESTDKLIFDLNFTGLPDSKLAQQAEAMKGKTSKFGKFLVDSAALNMNGFGILLEEDKQNMKSLVGTLKANALSELEGDGQMSSDEAEVVQGLMDDIFALVESTIDGGFIDFGGTLMMDAGSANFMFGGNLSDASKFDALVKKVTGIAKSQNEVALETEKVSVAGISFDKFTVTLPEGVDQEVIDMLGETVVVMMGRKGEEAYMAIGNDPGPTVEAIMGNSKSNSEYPVQYNVRLLPIMKFASNIPEAKDVIDSILADFDSKNDRISIFSKVIENGQSMRGEMDADILKMIGAAAKSAQGQLGGAEF